MDYKDILRIVAVIFLILVGAYLRGQAYRSVYGNATIGRDIERLWQNLKRWIRDRMESKKHKSKQ